ncbi:MAG: condensation domain-containing protein, partial [Ignavibacteria bacterium]
MSDSTNKNLTAQEKIALLKKQLLEKTKQQNAFYPLSYGQKALYFLHLDSPESAAYNVAFVTRILSQPDIPVLKRSFQKLINKHPSLRTTYSVKEGKPVQEVQGYQEIFFEEVKADDLNEEELKTEIQKVYSTPFDLEKGPVFKVYLFRVTNENYVLLINMHHICSDGWS